jgi:hypothetical protein
MPALAALAAAAACCALVLAGCGRSGAVRTADTRPGQYLSAVQSLLDAPAQLAQIVADQLGPLPGPAPEATDVRDLLARGRRQLELLRRIPLTDSVLRTQRARIVARFPRVLAAMKPVVDDLARHDRVALRADATPFFNSVRLFPSLVAASPSP